MDFGFNPIQLNYTDLACCLRDSLNCVWNNEHWNMKWWSHESKSYYVYRLAIMITLNQV